MSKRAKKKLEKLETNKNLDDVTKQEIIEDIGKKRQKTTESQSKFFIEGERKVTAE